MVGRTLIIMHYPSIAWSLYQVFIKAGQKKNVFINNLRIGMTNTKIHKRMKKNLTIKKRLKLIPINRMAKPQEISTYIVNLTTDTNSYMTGQTVIVSGGE